MFNAITLLGPFAVVESFQASDEVSCNPADTLEADAMTYVLFHYSVTSCHHAPTLPGGHVQGSMSLVASQSLPS